MKRSVSRPSRRACSTRSFGLSSSWWCEQHVVHLPEGALRGRRLGRLRRQLCARVHVGQRQVAPHVPQVVAELGQQVADRPSRPGRSTGTRSRRTRPASPGRPVAPRTWSRVVVHRRRQVDQRLGRGGQLACAELAGQHLDDAEQRHATIAAAQAAAASTPAFASSSCSPSNARPAISSATVNPMPAIAPPPASVGQATGGCSRPRSSFDGQPRRERRCRPACRRRSRRRCRS